MADAIEAAADQNRLRADHLLHLRCEVASSDVLEHFEDFETDPRVRLISLMDHSPGQRQFQSMEQYIFYYQKKRGLSDEAFAEFVRRRQAASAEYSAKHRDYLAARCAERGITVASHDDATEAHVGEAIGHGVKLAEFPTSVEAAKASHSAGMSVLMGAPNIVRGKSHSGNIAARDLAEIGVLDVLSSDYVPFSLLFAPFLLADQVGSTDFIIRTVEAAAPGSAIGIGTEIHLVQRLAADNPDKHVVSLDPMLCPCSTMFRIDAPHLAWVLEGLVEGEVRNRITVDADTREWARVALDRMLTIT